MVNSCAAYDCTNRRVKGDGMKFHRFPLKNKELCAKWIAAMKRDKFIRPKTVTYVEVTSLQVIISMLTQLNLTITLRHPFLNCLSIS